MHKMIRVSDFLHRRKDDVEIIPDVKYRLVTVKLHHKGVVLREIKRGSQIGSKMFKIRKGQFILSGIDARNGAFGIVPDTLDGAIITNDFWCFDVDESIMKRDFFYWLTNTPLFLAACEKSSKGETQRIRLQRDLFFGFEFHVPPIDKQEDFLRRIKRTESAFSALRDELLYQKRMLSQLRQSILQEAISGKLTAEWRKQHPELISGENHASKLLEKIGTEKDLLTKKRKMRKEKPLPPITDDEKPFILPKGWAWCGPAELGSFTGGGTPNTAVKEYWNGMIPWISPKDMKCADILKSELSITQRGVENSNAVILPADTIIFVVRSGILKRTIPISIARTRSTINQDLKAWLLVKPKMADFLRINILGNEKRLLCNIVKKGMTVESFDFDKFKRFPIPLPPFAEQIEIVKTVRKIMATIDDLQKDAINREEQSELLIQSVSTRKLTDTKLLRYIGKIAIAFCELEDAIVDGVSKELHDDFDDIGYLVTCDMGFRKTVDLYGRLVRFRLKMLGESARVPDFEKFLNEIIDISIFRNDVIHNIRFNDDGELFIKRRYKKELIGQHDGDEKELPRKGTNSEFPKFRRLKLDEKMLKKFLKRIENACVEIPEWEMQ